MGLVSLDRAPDQQNTTKSISRLTKYGKMELLAYDIRRICCNRATSLSGPTECNRFVVRTDKIRQIRCPGRRNTTKSWSGPTEYYKFVVGTNKVRQFRRPDQHNTTISSCGPTNHNKFATNSDSANSSTKCSTK